MSRSIWLCSGVHWVRVLASWSGFALLTFAVGESSSAGAGAIDKAAAPVPVVAPAPSAQRAGEIVVTRISTFDFNAPKPERFGDGDTEGPLR